MNDVSVRNRSGAGTVAVVDTTSTKAADAPVSTETVKAQVTILVSVGASTAKNADENSRSGSSAAVETKAAPSQDVTVTVMSKAPDASGAQSAPVAVVITSPDTASQTSGAEPTVEIHAADGSNVSVAVDGDKVTITTSNDANPSQAADAVPTATAVVIDTSDQTPAKTTGATPEAATTITITTTTPASTDRQVSGGEQAYTNLSNQLAANSQGAAQHTQEVLYGSPAAPAAGSGDAATTTTTVTVTTPAPAPTRQVSGGEQAYTDLSNQLAANSQAAADHTQQVLYGSTAAPAAPTSGSGGAATTATTSPTTSPAPAPARQISGGEQAQIDLTNQLAANSKRAADQTQTQLYGSPQAGSGTAVTPGGNAPTGSTPPVATRQISNTEKAFNDLSTLMAGNSAQMAKQTDQVLYANQAAATGVSVPRPAPTGGEVATAAGTLAKYQSDNGITLMNVNDVYELSRNPNVSPEVRNAAKFMVENPDIYRDIEVKGKATPDQVNSVGEMQQTARELAGDTKPYVPKSTSPAIDATPTQANVATAANSLVQHMKDTGVEELNATDLNKLAYDPTVSEDVRKAAKFMLQNTDVYAALEAQSAAAGPRPAPTRGDVATAAGTLAQYQQDSHIDFMTSDEIYNLSRNALVPENVRNAAKFMVENPDIYHDIEVKAGQASDQKSSINEMRDMATEMGSDVGSPYVPKASSVAITSAPSAEGTTTAINSLGTYMSEKGMTELNVNDLNAMLYSPDTSDDVKRAAKYMLQNSDVYESLSNASVAATPAPAPAPASPQSSYDDVASLTGIA